MSILSEPNSGENLTQSDSENTFDDSNSINFAKTWPNKHQDTIQTLKDAQIDVKKHQIERHEAEMQADIVEHETSIQAEVREITAEITELRIEVSALEKELGDVQEQLKNDIIDIAKENSAKIDKYQAKIMEDEPIIEQLKSAIRAQRENHERNKDIVELRKKEDMTPIDYQIMYLTNEIELMRKKMITAAKTGDRNIADAESSETLINSELESIDLEIQKLNDMKQKAIYSLSALKRELIIYEETALSLRSQIEKASQTRTKIKFILNRSQMEHWKSRTNFL